MAFTGFYIISKLFYFELKKYNSLKYILLGVIAGITGYFLMYVGVVVDKSLFRLDLRHLPLILLAYYNARKSLIIAAVIIIGSRFSFEINIFSFITILHTCLLVIGLIWVNKKIKKSVFLQIFLLNCISLILTTLILLFKFGWTFSFLNISFTVWFIGMIVGGLSGVLANDFEQINKKVKEYKYFAEIDFLTGLLNRRTWEMKTNENNQKSDNYTIIILDLDYFKSVNDTYGHDIGDLVLKESSEILRRVCHPEHVIARLGGEEFIISLGNLSSKEAKIVAENIRASVEKNKFITSDKKVIRITTSVGMAHVTNTTSLMIALKQADNALYLAKESGRNNVQVSNF